MVCCVRDEREVVGTERLKLNDSASSPLRFIKDGKTIGQFYNSADKIYHLAEYEPYKRPPKIYLCGMVGNFSPSRNENEKRPMCSACWKDIL